MDILDPYSSCVPVQLINPFIMGFLAETAQEVSGAGHESREWFKMMLDEDLLDQMRKKSSDQPNVPRIQEVEKWYVPNFG